MEPDPHSCDTAAPQCTAPVREAASDLLRALAAPTRISIVLSLQQSAKCVHELVGTLELSQPLVSQHLRVLKDAGVVRGHRNGREIMYELIDDHLAHIVIDALVHAGENRDAAGNRDDAENRDDAGNRDDAEPEPPTEVAS